MASVFPFGNLISFGTYTFTDHRSALVNPGEEVQVTYAPVVGRVYPVDRLGNSTATLANTLKTFEYHIVAQDYSPAAGQELYVCEQQYNLLVDFLLTLNTDGTTKAVQTLTVRSGDGSTLRTASARLTKVDVKEWLWNYIHVDLSFALRGSFA